jgi:hypothetical protein
MTVMLKIMSVFFTLHCKCLESPETFVEIPGKLDVSEVTLHNENVLL